MPRYKPKTNHSRHAARRCSERYGDVDVGTLTRQATNGGIRMEQIPPDSPLYEYVFFRCNKMGKVVRLYDGYVFVMSKNGRLITMYPIHPDMMPFYEPMRRLEKRNRDRRRRDKRKRG